MGCSNDNPQQLDAFAGGLSQTFTATVDLEQLVVCLEGLPRGRATLAYQAQLIAAGGTQGTLSWDLDPASDPLPTGLTLNPDGAFSGAPSEDGVFPFVARVQDGLGGSAAAPFVLNICEAPVSLPVGGTQVLSTTSPGGCGFLLPAGVNGDRYRIGLVYASSTQDSLDLASVTVSMEKQAGVPALSARLRRAPAPSPAFQVSVPSIPSRSAVSIQQDIDRDRATEAFHRRLRAAERKLFERLGPELRPLPDLRLQRAITEGVFKAPPPPAPEKMTFRHAQDDFESCEVERTARAVKIAENDLMVFYQDSIQNAGSPVSVANVRSMLDYYRDYGTQVIDSYFEGVPDTNGDGRTVVLVTPEAGGNTVAFVWSGDYLSTSSCPASNGMELVRFNRTTIQQMSSANPSYQALSALVHEMRHIKSLFNGVLRSGQYQPDWVEEGVAEIAGEVSSRLAWAATGGPAVGAFVGRGHWIASSPENWGVILKMARTVGYLGWQPNGVLETPAGGGPYQSSYGAGWHFHRWLGDAYGDAATPLAEAPLFAALNRVEGRLAVGGVEDATGKQWVELMEEYLAAILVNGVDAPLGPRTFTTYDFPGSVAGINLLVNYGAERPGRYPWPVNVTGLSTTAPFATASRGGTLGPSGIQVLDLTSDGSGLGLEVEVTASDQPVRVVVARIH
jgi:hypothetical protein